MLELLTFYIISVLGCGASCYWICIKTNTSGYRPAMNIDYNMLRFIILTPVINSLIFIFSVFQFSEDSVRNLLTQR